MGVRVCVFLQPPVHEVPVLVGPLLSLRHVVPSLERLGHFLAQFALDTRVDAEKHDDGQYNTACDGEPDLHGGQSRLIRHRVCGQGVHGPV